MVSMILLLSRRPILVGSLTLNTRFLEEQDVATQRTLGQPRFFDSSLQDPKMHIISWDPQDLHSQRF